MKKFLLMAGLSLAAATPLASTHARAQSYEGVFISYFLNQQTRQVGMSTPAIQRLYPTMSACSSGMTGYSGQANTEWNSLVGVGGTIAGGCVATVAATKAPGASLDIVQINPYKPVFAVSVPVSTTAACEAANIPTGNTLIGLPAGLAPFIQPPGSGVTVRGVGPNTVTYATPDPVEGTDTVFIGCSLS